jgi:hypothetical protein
VQHIQVQYGAPHMVSTPACYGQCHIYALSNMTIHPTAALTLGTQHPQQCTIPTAPVSGKPLSYKSCHSMSSYTRHFPKDVLNGLPYSAYSVDRRGNNDHCSASCPHTAHPYKVCPHIFLGAAEDKGRLDCSRCAHAPDNTATAATCTF